MVKKFVSLKNQAKKLKLIINNQLKGGSTLNRLKERFNTEVTENLVKKFNYSSVMEVPKIEKIVVNMGVGDAVQNSKVLDNAVEELELITGQKPLVTKAKKSVATFRLREGMPIGAKVTLRGERMYEFLDKLIAVSLPRVRDFQGVSKTAFDGRGNYTCLLYTSPSPRDQA